MTLPFRNCAVSIATRNDSEKLLSDVSDCYVGVVVYVMSAFLISILASIIAGALLLFATSALSRGARWVLTGALGRLLDIDIEAVFADKLAAEAEVRRELLKATEISIVTTRGNELQRDTFDPLFLNRRPTKNLRVRILLPVTSVEPGQRSWIDQREQELATFDHAFGAGLLRDQVEANVRFLQKYVSAGHVELRRFNAPHWARLVLTERCAFLTPYQKDAHGRDSVVYKFRRGNMYDSLLRLFEQLWKSDAPKLQLEQPEELS